MARSRTGKRWSRHIPPINTATSFALFQLFPQHLFDTDILQQENYLKVRLDRRLGDAKGTLYSRQRIHREILDWIGIGALGGRGGLSLDYMRQGVD